MAEEKTVDDFKVVDNSDLRKYYTAIPNCVVNGSGIYEKAMYMEMKRFAGANPEGKCFASIRTMAKRLEVTERIVIRTIKKLLKRGWIEQLESRATGGRPVNCYRIVDIWGINFNQCSPKKKKTNYVVRKCEEENFSAILSEGMTLFSPGLSFEIYKDGMSVSNSAWTISEKQAKAIVDSWPSKKKRAIKKDLEHAFINEQKIHEPSMESSEKKKRGINKEGYIYLLQCRELCKIGITQDPEYRLDRYVTENPFPITVLLQAEVLTPATLEKNLLNKYSAKLVKGKEWFKLSEEDIEEIKTIVLDQKLDDKKEEK